VATGKMHCGTILIRRGSGARLDNSKSSFLNQFLLLCLAFGSRTLLRTGLEGLLLTVQVPVPAGKRLVEQALRWGPRWTSRNLGLLLLRIQKLNPGGWMTHIPAGGSFRRNLMILLFAGTSAICTGGHAYSQDARDPIPAAVVERTSPYPAVAAPAFTRPLPAVDLSSTSDLPDAPVRAESPTSPTSDWGDSRFEESRPADEYASVISTRAPGYVSLDQCPDDITHARSCRVHWHQLLISTAAFNTLQNAGNLYTGYWYRWETSHGVWFQRWINSAAGWRWNVWSDQNPVLDVYVGHPMMGGITNYLWIQNDPKGMTVDFGNTHEYWNSRIRAFIFSTAYSFEWKLGPFGEAGIGHNGDHLVPLNGVPPDKWTNETGWAELVTTPVGGLLWTMAEDALDKHVVRKLEEKPRGPFTLLFVSFLTPARSTANIFRFRPPWYRDGRRVSTNTFWVEPGRENDAALGADGDPPHRDAVVSTSERRVETLPEWPRYGGVHEFGAWWGLSLMSGHIWGYAKDVKYMPIEVSYSYLLNPGAKWNFRYAPEFTALAMLDEPNWAAADRFTQRRRSYGSGVSPLGFRASFYPESRVQPFLSTNGGCVYFDERVLSPQGSQFMYTIDFGGGIQIFRKERQAISIGYRYQHLSNANISLHNPGTDTNVFYVAVSRFRTKHYR
jgi:hypothetical protein